MPHHPALHRIKKAKPDYIDSTMSVIAVLSPLTTLPQIIQIFQTKNVEGISLITWTFSIITSSIWLAYGLHHKDKPVIFNSLIGGTFCSLITIGILLYR